MESAYTSLSSLALTGLENIHQQQVLLVFLISIRIAIVIGMTPVLYGMPIPGRAKIILIVFLSLALSTNLSPESSQTLNSTGAIFTAASQEAALGIILALGILLAFAAFGMAGNLLDTQIGFGIAQVFNPSNNLPSPLLNSTFNFLAVIVFFLMNGHHALLRGLSYSVHAFPIGQPWSVAYAFPSLLKQAAGLFSMGFALASPVVFALLMVEFSLSVISRSLPQINMLTMGIPVKILVGIAALSLWFMGMGSVMSNIYASIYKTWNAIFIAYTD